MKTRLLVADVPIKPCQDCVARIFRMAGYQVDCGVGRHRMLAKLPPDADRPTCCCSIRVCPAEGETILVQLRENEGPTFPS